MVVKLDEKADNTQLEDSHLEHSHQEHSHQEHSALEKRGRRWLIWSFIFCPCHLPLSMAVLAALFGGTAFGSLVSRNTLGTGLVLGAIYLTGIAIGFRYLRQATKGIDCSDGACTLPEAD